VSARVLERLLDPSPLSRRDVRATFDSLTAHGANDTERAAVLIALSARARRPAEIVALAREMRRRARPFRVDPRDGAIDLCGCGGASTPSFNVSTVSAFVVRAAGVRVVKHGNRSRRICGSSDLLDALGLPVLTSVAFARDSYRRLGIAFLHAPLFQPAMATVATVRARLGVPTVFNRLGPLVNPARVRGQVVGVPDLATARDTPHILRALGVRRGLAMTSDEGCDEFSPRRPTTVEMWNGSRQSQLRIRPERWLEPEERRGAWGALSPPRAAEAAEHLLAGGGGARRGSVLLTSGAALWSAGAAKDLGRGVDLARDALDSGAAERMLEELREIGTKYSPAGGS
jgi:anthranilate phosphoribosyltransferase